MRPLSAMILLIPVTCGCLPEPGDQHMAWLRGGDGYEIGSRARGALTDPRRLDGDLGRGWAGGRVTLEDGLLVYQEGLALDIPYDVDGQTSVPLDRDGLILWSFYSHLDDFVAELPEHGIDPAPLLPLTIAHTPSLPDLLLEYLPMENAAYATGGHLFLLFEDLLGKEVPLAANAGVVRHEFGHAVFHAMTAGGVSAPAPFEVGDTSADANAYASLHEGFADLLAALTLDTPDLFDGSLVVPARELTGAHAVSGVTLPEEFADSQGDALLAIYDPYPLGTVFASTIWDVRAALDDPDAALAVALDGTEAWAAAGDFGDAWGLLDAWVVAAEGTPGAQSALCDAIDARFAGAHQSAACP